MSRIHVARVDLEGFAKRSRSALGITLLLESGTEKVLRLCGVGLQVESVPEFGNRLLVVAFVERGLALSDVEIRILLPVISGESSGLSALQQRLVFTSARVSAKPNW